MREYKPVSVWEAEHPGVKALIVSLPAGPTFIIKPGTFVYLRVSLHGVIE